MKKVIVFLILAMGIAFLEPRTRAQIMKVIQPARDVSRRDSAERTLERIAKDMEKTAQKYGIYPQPDAFDQWLLQTYRSANDPWGSEYYAEYYSDRYVVGSPGPDGERGTADDVRLTKRR